MSSFGIISDVQHGFVPGRSCMTNLLLSIQSWSKSIDEGDNIDAIFLDFSKAFDTVPHERLLVKLRNIGISGHVLEWIEAFLKNRKQRVIVNGSASPWVDVISGIPQGTVLGPLLFVVFINDMPNVCESLVNLLADDSKLWRIIDSEVDAVTLQEDIDNLTQWSDIWQLLFNATKCVHCPIGKDQGNVYSMLDLQSGIRINLDRSNCEKHLGVHIDSNLSFDYQISCVIDKANAMLGMIRRTYSHLGAQDFKMIYTALVRPILEYGAVVWNPVLRKHIDSLERVQRRFTRFLPGLRSLSYEQRLQSLNLPTLAYRRYRGDMIDTWKLTHGLYDIDISQLITMDRPVRTRGHSLKLFMPRNAFVKRDRYFSSRIVDSWNSLPDSVVTAETVNAFKSRLDRHAKDNKMFYSH
jgi:hypothetical protein